MCTSDHQPVDDSLCKLSRPAEERECSNENCVREPVFTWKVGEWGNCGQTCGYALHSREVSCLNEQSRVVNTSFCTEPHPIAVEQCFEGPCPPKWVAEPWSEVCW